MQGVERGLGYLTEDAILVVEGITWIEGDDEMRCGVVAECTEA